MTFNFLRSDGIIYNNFIKELKKSFKQMNKFFNKNGLQTLNIRTMSNN
jgi:hypothetical protein